MTANQTNMAAGTTELHLTVDGDAPAVLDINTGDVASMALLDDGVLQITLKDGNVVHIENFEALADEGVVLELADGSVLNTDALLSALGGTQAADAAPIDALQAEGVLGETALSFGENVIIDQPENGEIALYVYDADNTYTLNIALDQVLDTRAQDEIFLIAFDDGSRILLRGFDGGEQNADQATLLLDGEQLRLQDLLENLRLAMTDRDAPESDLQRSIIEDLDQTDLASVAEQLASIQPAAGETAGGGAGASQGGFGFQSAASDEGFSIPGSSIDGAVGPIGPTSLAFGGDDAEEIENGPVTAEGAPAATPAPSITLPPTTLNEDGTLDLTFTADKNAPAAGNIVTTIVISNIPAGWTVNPQGGTYDAVNGTWTTDIPAGTTTFTGGPLLTPPADSDVDANDILVTLTNTDTVSGDSTVTTDTFDIIVDAVADAPTLNAADDTGAEDTALDLDITTAVTDTDGSEDIAAVFVRNVPNGFTLSAGQNNGGGEWQLTPAELAGLQVNAPANYSGTVTLDIVSVSQETPTDQETTTANNSAETQTSVDLTWTPQADAPSITASNASVNEDGTVTVPLAVDLVDTDGSESLTVTISNVPTGWTFNSPGFVAAGAGTYELTLPAGQGFNGDFTLTPPADSDVDLPSLDITATTTEAGNGHTATTSTSISVAVEAVADAPTLTANSTVVDEDGTVAIDVESNLSDTDGSESLTLTVTGVPTGWSFAGAGWAATGNAGEYSITVAAGQNYSDSFTLTPPADSDVDLTGLQITSTATEAANNDQAQTQTTIDVTVDAVADAPTVDAQNASGEEGTAIALDISGTATDTDGSESITGYRIESVDSGFSFNQGTNLGGGVWTFTPAEIVGLEVNAPANYYGSID
ncbi:MAG: Ig-like domain-containing protein, partial [Alphaproteobacteria bacterium]|nr:Ig-like domain-containing protein [Alphaproteobacteria bacterium]